MISCTTAHVTLKAYPSGGDDRVLFFPQISLACCCLVFFCLASQNFRIGRDSCLLIYATVSFRLVPNPHRQEKRGKILLL